MANNLSTKTMKLVIADLERQGATTRPTSAAGGYLVKFPNGFSCTFHGSVSDHRAINNMRSYVRKGGLTWLLDGGKK